MNNSIQGKKGNPVVTLKAQAEKFNFSKLRAGKENLGANSGNQMHLDFPRMKFIINKKDIDQDFIKQLYKEHAGLIENDRNGEKNYRQFAKEVFQEMFKYAEAKIPSDPILEELVINCNQAGYEGALSTDMIFPVFVQSKLSPLSPQKIINISCKSPNCVELKSRMKVPIIDKELISLVENDKEAVICDLLGLLEFTLESQDRKDDVTYKNGKLSLTVPRKLRDYKIDGRSLFDIIKEYFYKFCEKLGFKLKIEHDLGDSIEVNSHLESVQPTIHSNEHENTL